MWDDIGNTFAHWEYPGGQPQNLVFLCALADTPVLWFGQEYTHVLKCLDFGSGYQARFARINGADNVLNELSPPYSSFLNFPYGIPVEPDHV